MVGAEKVVINGLRDAYNVYIVARFRHILAYFVASIHTVVSAVIEKIPHVVFFENFKQFFIIGVVNRSVFELISD